MHFKNLKYLWLDDAASVEDFLGFILELLKILTKQLHELKYISILQATNAQVHWRITVLRTIKL